MDNINLNMGFRLPVVIHAGNLAWTRSPQAGVERRRLERENAESGRATTIVRYAPGSDFPRHRHTAGEEYLVLQGTFSDETGDHRVGCYVRNPPDSIHTPFSKDGCVIFVKLCQMQPDEKASVTIDTQTEAWVAQPVSGHRSMPLYASPFETVTLEHLEAGTAQGEQISTGGIEILVLEGHLQSNEGTHGPLTWMRYPDGFIISLASRDGCTFWMKRGHLHCAAT